MTMLIGTSLLLVVGSAIALVFGWATVNSSLVWTSIVASIGSAVFLALAFYGSRVQGDEDQAPIRRGAPWAEAEADDEDPAADGVDSDGKDW